MDIDALRKIAGVTDELAAAFRAMGLTAEDVTAAMNRMSRAQAKSIATDSNSVAVVKLANELGGKVLTYRDEVRYGARELSCAIESFVVEEWEGRDDTGLFDLSFCAVMSGYMHARTSAVERALSFEAESIIPYRCVVSVDRLRIATGRAMIDGRMHFARMSDRERASAYEKQVATLKTANQRKKRKLDL